MTSEKWYPNQVFPKARVIAIGGEPACGKTTLMRMLKSKYDTSPFKYGKVKGEYDVLNNVFFIGVFDGSTFEGTDKLSMAVQPDFEDFLENYATGVVVFEGDRLFTPSLFEKFLCEIFILTTENDLLDVRHKRRKDNQSETFLKGRKTKITNIMASHACCLLPNNDFEQMEYNINVIKQRIDAE